MNFPEIEPKSSNIPQFKKLPNMRKSFEQIEEYIAKLPKDLESATSGNFLCVWKRGVGIRFDRQSWPG